MYSLLIVDDEPIIRRGIKTFIDFDKYGITDIYEAEDGNSASKVFSEVLPDLVLLDINMPFKDGLTVAKEMKNIKKGTKIAIITGYDYFEYAQKALKIGVEDYILKPVSKKDINEIITKLVFELNEEKKHIEAEKLINKIKNETTDTLTSNSKYKSIISKKIEDNFSDVSFNLNSLADDLSLSSGYLSSLFKSLFGVPFQNYLNNVRMEKAKLLLLTTDLKNYEIGERIGFENVHYFNSKFKKTFGITPKEFKKNIVEKN
ncbi:response regulator [Leptotrichia sp. OH3620_COT-345]|uniref:response regulator transcription factor n=1 Tax=Leptotrichia sp. OH3620_COT-345 TaxID=2491048 RepID=UPI000F6501A7|nr:response regulator [Leptotrichia sp. OH3620_COT-345]RRD38919.1 response regulator [Leptotrichia sp. OH3620_COT-345]